MTHATTPLAATPPLLVTGTGRSAARNAAAPGFRQMLAEIEHFITSGSAPAPAAGAAPARVPTLPGAANPAGAAASFVAAIAPAAESAARQLGLSPRLLAAQAALESGWGRQPLRASDGSDSHNLFGIKAGAGWRGASLLAATHEVEQGLPQAVQARFRRYPDTGAAFADYARLLQQQPRFAAALQAGDDAHAFGQALASAGYASDPGYADKLARVAASLPRHWPGQPNPHPHPPSQP